MRVCFALAAPKMGFRAVYLVNEAGLLVHTEAVCAFPEAWHPWFFAWLEQQAHTLPDHVHRLAADLSGPAPERRWGLAGNAVLLPAPTWGLSENVKVLPPEGKTCGVVDRCKCEPDGLAHAGICENPSPCSVPGHGGEER